MRTYTTHRPLPARRAAPSPVCPPHSPMHCVFPPLPSVCRAAPSRFRARWPPSPPTAPTALQSMRRGALWSPRTRPSTGGRPPVGGGCRWLQAGPGYTCAPAPAITGSTACRLPASLPRQVPGDPFSQPTHPGAVQSKSSASLAPSNLDRAGPWPSTPASRRGAPAAWPSRCL